MTIVGIRLVIAKSPGTDVRTGVPIVPATLARVRTPPLVSLCRNVFNIVIIRVVIILTVTPVTTPGEEGNAGLIGPRIAASANTLEVLVEIRPPSRPVILPRTSAALPVPGQAIATLNKAALAMPLVIISPSSRGMALRRFKPLTAGRSMVLDRIILTQPVNRVVVDDVVVDDDRVASVLVSVAVPGTSRTRVEHTGAVAKAKLVMVFMAIINRTTLRT